MSAPITRSVRAAVLLAGGRARRLGGVDKPALAVGGRPLLTRVLAAVPYDQPRVVVGPRLSDAPRDLVWVREHPAGGGPVAALAAGLRHIPPNATRTAVLAADLPFLTSAVVSGLDAALQRAPDAAGALLVDGDGRRQLLCGVWRTPAVRSAVSMLAEPQNAAMHRLFADLPVVTVRWPVPPGEPPPWWDCDTASDLETAREWI
jgi:molybdenum cofactor guanylyltransferase